MNREKLLAATVIIALTSTTYADDYDRVHSRNYSCNYNCNCGCNYNYNRDFKRDVKQVRFKYAWVVNVIPIYQNVRCYEPPRTCHYKHRATLRDNTTAVIVGSLLGDAIANELGYKRTNQRVGVLVGAVLGSSVANDVTRGKRSFISRQEQVCVATRQVRYREKVTGYNVGCRFRGQTYCVHRDHRSGDRVKITVSVRPVI